MNKWYQSMDIDNIVISNRIRLARNIQQYPFPAKMEHYEAKALIAQIKLTMDKLKEYKFNYVELDEIGDLDKKEMVEHHMMSPYMLKQSLPGMVIFNQDETINIMVNEEDHLRIQGLGVGRDLASTWERITRLDDDIETNITYAFSEKYGYLTACPTNLGTGIRASYMLHLPILNKTGYLQELLGAVSKLGMSIRGIYGEGTKSLGSIYQISNQMTLGRTEEEIIENVQNITMQIVGKEESIRNEISEKAKNKLKDQVYRSYGILSYAREIPLSEAMNLLSEVKLGFEIGLYDIPKPDISIYEIMMGIQDATITRKKKEENINLPLDVVRANIIRKYLRKDS